MHPNGTTAPDRATRYHVPCEWCGREFLIWAYRPRRFCSLTCLRAEEATHHVTCTCLLCGATFSVKRSRFERGAGRFCSRACSDAGRAHPRKPLAERFWAKVHKGDGCWVWTGPLHEHGYGYICVGGRRGSNKRAHIVSWELAYGHVPDGMHVLHHCDNPACVRPEHLWLGTHQQNMDDMQRKGRANRIGRKPQKNRAVAPDQS